MTQLMRDSFIDEIYRMALKDKDIVFISADFGAKALDDFRKNLPDQFIHAGISEQHMVDLGAGMAISGKKVFLYAMAPFITARCYEQVKAVASAMSLPITLIAVGVGLGYDHATLTHFTPEDIAIMRALNGIEVVSPCDAVVAKHLAMEAIERPAFRYVRLERLPLPDLYSTPGAESLIRNGFCQLEQGSDICVIATGYMTHVAIEVSRALRSEGINLGVIDVAKIKPLNTADLVRAVSRYKELITLDEQLLDGGLGSVVLEALADNRHMIPVTRMGIRDGFDVVNGDRQHLHQLYGIDSVSLTDKVKGLSNWKIARS